jgi:flagellar basal body-associated protein FliL
MNGQQKEYEEQTLISSAASWVILIVFPIIILSWGMFVEMIVMVGSSRWDFGVLPDTPSQSQYSTVTPPPDVNVPYQMQRIPYAQLPPGEIKQ